MPHEQMNERQVAAYLSMDEREVIKLASRGQIPCRKTGKGFVFRKGEVDHWIETQLHELPKHRFAGIEQGVSQYHGFDPEALLVSALIPPNGLAVPLKARTREAVIRSLVTLANDNGLLYDKDRLLEEIREREELCSTAIAPGVALPHPRHPLPYDIAESFLIVGITPSGIPFGAADGSLTRLFFLVCCKDDRTHLHVLARLARMLHDAAATDNLLTSQSPEELRELLLQLERFVLEHPG
ncbi:MAG: PTS sugar transporter subunit IIA [Phycisphaerae bacterium]|nr:PTS sugar transporter subunit IIA [Phycisphaerae bacterium]